MKASRKQIESLIDSKTLEKANEISEEIRGLAQKVYEKQYLVNCRRVFKAVGLSPSLVTPEIAKKIKENSDISISGDSLPYIDGSLVRKTGYNLPKGRWEVNSACAKLAKMDPKIKKLCGKLEEIVKHRNATPDMITLATLDGDIGETVKEVLSKIKNI